MARRGESVSDLYLRLGLSYDELESGFVDASRTIRDNMARLSRENRIIDLQAQVEIAGLDETADSARILELRMRSLALKIENQRDRVRLATAELRNMREAHGETSDQAIRAQVQLEHERVALANLEQQLRRATAAQEALNSATSSGASSSGASSSSASSAGTAIPDLIGDAIEKLNEELSHLPPTVKIALGATAAMVAVIGKGVSATAQWVNEWRELQKQAYELNMTFDETDDFLDHMKLAGGDIGDWEGFIRGITDAYVKGEWDDPELITLERFGAQIIDVNGNLKNFKAITEEIFKAWKKAKAEGNEIEFLQMLGGESGIRDAQQYLQRYEEGLERLGDILDANIDHNKIEEYEKNFSELSLQYKNFGDSLNALIAPISAAFSRLFTDIFWRLTAVANALNTAFDKLGDAINNPLRAFINLKKAFGFDLTPIEKTIDITIDALDETKKKADELGDSTEKNAEQLNQYTVKRIHAIEDEIRAKRISIDYESEYQQAIANAELERANAIREATRLGYISSAERIAIEKRYLLEVETATKEHNEKIEEMTRETAAMQYAASHSAFEKEIYDIENWKQEALDALGDYKDAIGDKNQWLKESAAITAKAAAKEAQAFEKEVDKIKGKFQSLEEKIFEMQHSQHENDVMRARKEAQEMLDEGLAPERVAKYLALAIAKINAESRENSDRLKRPNYQLVNPPDFSEYDQMQAQINADVEKYKADMANKAIDAKDDAQKAIDDIDNTINSSMADSVDKLNLSVTNINGAFITAGDSAYNLANSLQNVSDQINNTNINQPTTNGQTPNSAKSDSDNKSDNKPAGKNDNINFSDFSSRLAELTKTVGTIAQEVTKKNTQPPQVNVNPNISLNLSGSYILTQEMVNQLAYDCTTEVANGVTDAVTKALNNIRI